jgi:IclR family transcriptional regulator, mhp operon transcriptional activator
MVLRAVKTIRSLDRGLEVLRLLSQSHPMGLTELQRQVSLPKATLCRILRTLQSQGYVWQGIGDSRYRASYSLRAMGEALGPPDRIAEVAGPILDKLCAKVLWPSDLSVRNGLCMQLVETSRSHSYFLLNRLQIGFRINMLLSAPGRAYLAHCPDEERDEILSMLRAEKDPGHYLAYSPGQIKRILKETRERGYGSRERTWGGHYNEPKAKFNDRLTAIAVPILGRSKVLGCINIVWFERLFRQEEMARRHLGDLTKAAQAIAKECERQSLSP